MIVGNAMLRSFNSGSQEATSLNFRCLDANYGNSGVTGKPGSDSNALPAGPFAGGIRSQIVFPTSVIDILDLLLVAQTFFCVFLVAGTV